MQLDLALDVKIIYLTEAFSREIMLEKEQKSLLNNVTKTTTVTNTGDAVGVSDGRFWCVGIVTCRNEKKVAERVAQAGYEVYLPLRSEVHLWSQALWVRGRIFVFDMGKQGRIADLSQRMIDLNDAD